MYKSKPVWIINHTRVSRLCQQHRGQGAPTRNSCKVTRIYQFQSKLSKTQIFLCLCVTQKISSWVLVIVCDILEPILTILNLISAHQSAPYKLCQRISYECSFTKCYRVGKKYKMVSVKNGSDADLTRKTSLQKLVYYVVRKAD